MDCQTFVQKQIASIRESVGDGCAINALSGGVDSSVVTVIGHRALGDRLRTIFVDSALMREDEPQRVVDIFKDLGMPVENVDARAEFLEALRGLTDPEDTGAFQYLAVLLNDKATGIRDGRREFGQIVVVRCLNSVDARTATSVDLPWEKLHRICQRVTSIADVNRCLYDITPKPPATIEYI